MQTVNIRMSIPTMAGYDTEDFISKVRNYAEALAKKLQTGDKDAKLKTSAKSNWRDHVVSPEVMAMTFSERKTFSDDYKAELTEALEEKYR